MVRYCDTINWKEDKEDELGVHGADEGWGSGESQRSKVAEKEKGGGERNKGFVDEREKG